MLRWCTVVVVLVACSGRQHVVRPVMPVCTSVIHAGVSTRALAFNGHGWGAAVVESSTLYLREFNYDGTPNGDRVTLADVPALNTRVALAWSQGSYYAMTGPARAGGSMTTLRANALGTHADAFAIDEILTGELDVIPRPEVVSHPAALLFERTDGTVISTLGIEGEPGSMRLCPTGVFPHAVKAWGREFRAAAVETDPATGDARAIDVVAFEDNGSLLWRTRAWTGEVNGHAHTLAVDDEGTVVTFADREGGAWIVGTDHTGHITLRANRLERRARAPQVFLQTDTHGRRTGIQVTASRTTEIGDRLETWRLGSDGILRDVREVTTSPAIELRYSVADPWGGAITVFSREETTRGSARTGAGTYDFFARICP
jgi:hypothetical protein